MKAASERGPQAPVCRRPQHGEVLPLKIVTYAAVALSLAALLVAFVLLALARTLRSNLHSAHRNLIAALFLSQLVFVVGVTQTANPVRPPPRPPSPCPGPYVPSEAGGRSGAPGLAGRLCAQRDPPPGPVPASPPGFVTLSERTVTHRSSEPRELRPELQWPEHAQGALSPRLPVRQRPRLPALSASSGVPATCPPENAHVPVPPALGCAGGWGSGGPGGEC